MNGLEAIKIERNEDRVAKKDCKIEVSMLYGIPTTLRTTSIKTKILINFR